jgi:hypothetical protein
LHFFKSNNFWNQNRLEINLLQITFLFQDAEPISIRVLCTQKRKSEEDNDLGAGTRSKRPSNNSRHDGTDDAPVLVESDPSILSVSDESCAQDLFPTTTIS